MKHIRIDIDDDGFATLTLDVPGRRLNVLDQETSREIEAALDTLLGDPGVRGLILTSAKPGFAAGGDLAMFQRRIEAARTEPDFDRRVERLFEPVWQYQRLLRRLETGGKPIVAAINGTALGGGLELCLACHHRIAADDPATRLGLPEIRVGLFPGAGGTQRLPSLIGLRKAAPLLLEGTSLTPRQALDLGVIHALAPANALLSNARQWLRSQPDPTQPWDRKGFSMPDGEVQSPEASRLLSDLNARVAARTHGNLPAAQAILTCLQEGLRASIDTGLRIESTQFARVLAEPTALSMVRTLFLSRKALERGEHRPSGVPERRFHAVGVLGAGMMGRSIALVAAMAGFQVRLLDRTAADAEAGKQYARNSLDKAVDRNQLSADEARAAADRIEPVADPRALADTDLVIEAVFEDRAIKAEITRRAAKIMPEGAVFASNTSTLPIGGLATAWRDPASFIGLHFFSPAERMPLVEIIRGEETSPETLAQALDFVRHIGKTPIVVRDQRGFYTSRTFATYVQEGMNLVLEGVPAALIENAGRQVGMPVGPLALADEVSLALLLSIRRQTEADLADRHRVLPSDDLLETMVNRLGRPGRAGGGGFYDYPADAEKQLWPGLTEQWPTVAEPPDSDALKQRLLYIQAIEAIRVLQEGVVSDPREIDVGAVLGWGFAAWTGGPLSLVDRVGSREFCARCRILAEACGARFDPPKLLVDLADRDGRFYEGA